MFAWVTLGSVLLLFSGIAFVPRAAQAEMSAITVAASVVSVGESTVKVRIEKKEVVLPKAMLNDRQPKEGDAILVTFRGDQMKYLLDEKGEIRLPASLSPKKKK